MLFCQPRPPGLISHPAEPLPSRSWVPGQELPPLQQRRLSQVPVCPSLALLPLAAALRHFSLFLHPSLVLLLLFSGSLGKGASAAAQQLIVQVLPCTCFHGCKFRASGRAQIFPGAGSVEIISTLKLDSLVPSSIPFPFRGTSECDHHPDQRGVRQGQLGARLMDRPALLHLH